MAKDKVQKPQQPPVPEAQLPENEKDLPTRIEGFNKELLPLLGKYELGLAAMPRFMQDGRVVADPILVSARTQQAPQAPTPPPAPAPGLSKVE